MKKILYICSAALVLAATGCSSKKDIDMDFHGGAGLEFVHFENASDAWLVSADDETFNYEVVVAQTYAHSESVTYNIAVGEKTTGEEGVDFAIPTKSVTIAKDQYFGKLPVEILYDTTGEGFVLELVLSVEDKLINPSYGGSALIAVNTDKVTIDWEWLAGKWSCQDYVYYNGANDGGAYPVSISKVDETHGTLNGLKGGDPINFTVDFDAKTISFEGNQYSQANADYECDFYFVAVNPETDYDVYDPIDTPFVGTLSPAGIVIDNYDFLMVGGTYDGYTFFGGVKSTLTKKK